MQTFPKLHVIVHLNIKGYMIIHFETRYTRKYEIKHQNLKEPVLNVTKIYLNFFNK